MISADGFGADATPVGSGAAGGVGGVVAKRRDSKHHDMLRPTWLGAGTTSPLKSRRMPRYRFLFDHDVQAAADALPASRVVTLTKVGLPPKASDEEVIDAACTHRCIIVTANGKDFTQKAVADIRQSSLRSQGRCHDLSGLVVLPTGLETQRRLLRQALQRMRYDDRPVTWPEVWARSYYVRLKDTGPADVRPLPRCRVCEANELRRLSRAKKSGRS